MLENLEPTTRLVVGQVVRVRPRPPYAGQFWTQLDTRLAGSLDGSREPFLRLLFSNPLTVRLVSPDAGLNHSPLDAMNPLLPPAFLPRQLFWSQAVGVWSSTRIYLCCKI